MRRLSFAMIHSAFVSKGDTAALGVARIALERGGLDARDMAEVFLAVRQGAAEFLLQLGECGPGTRRFSLPN